MFRRFLKKNIFILKKVIFKKENYKKFYSYSIQQIAGIYRYIIVQSDLREKTYEKDKILVLETETYR